MGGDATLSNCKGEATALRSLPAFGTTPDELLGGSKGRIGRKLKLTAEVMS